MACSAVGKTAMSTVRQALQSALDENHGAIAFDDFMRIALHHPQDGYYTRNIRAIGRGGDFTTVPQRSSALGQAIAGWLQWESKERGLKKLHVIECGPGDGSLAKDVLASFGWFARRQITLHLVETSAPLRELQMTKLRGGHVCWHENISSALDACEGRALIYHNEFFDAFPCRVFKKQTGEWLELHLRVREGRLIEDWIARPLPDSGVFEKSWPDGQRIEVFDSVRSWLRDVTAHWSEGAMLAIDYGGNAEEIYQRRRAGTLRAYRGRQRLTGDDVYEFAGHQDITADVNFDDLTKWSAELGWNATGTIPLSKLAPDAPGAEAFHYAVFAKL